MTLEMLADLVRRERRDICVDSRQATPGSVFVATPGAVMDGAQFIPAAVDAGATTVVCIPGCPQAQGLPAGVQVVETADPRAAVWHLAQARYGTDQLRLRLLGVTGTNGKTTTAYLLERLYSALGYKVGVIGTVSYRWPGHVEDAPLTTPDCLSLHRMLAAMQEAGVEVAIMEVSSHALSQQRVGGLLFDGAVFSNLTQDHLDYHQDMEHYFQAKAQLFCTLPRRDKALAVNADDPWGRKLLDLCPQALSFGLHGEGIPGRRHLAGRIVSSSTEGLWLEMRLDDQRWELHSPLVGAFNAANLMAVQALALECGVEPANFRVLEDFYGVPGRLERVANARNLDIFVDYAHTPDALVNVLRALRGAGFQRIITVFGCGGNRDRTKRPLMGQAVARYSDVAVLTSDNPRFEDPDAIIADVLPGLEGAKEVLVEPSRREATARALSMLRPGDALLVAGKGHEDYQLIAGVKHHYSDQETIRELLSCN